MKAERPRRLFRRGNLVAAFIASLLLLAPAPAQDRQAKDKKLVVQVSDSELSHCGKLPRDQPFGKGLCLRGRVRAITTESRMAQAQGGGLVESAPYSVVKHTYDERGNLTLIELSDGGNGPGPIGVVFRRGLNSFDEQNRLTNSTWYEAGADEPASSVTNEYDERGNRVKLDSWRTNPDAHHIMEYAFDAEGHEVEVVFSRLMPDGWQTDKTKKVTTVEGGLTIVRSYSAEGVLRGRGETLKDERSQLLSEKLYRIDARGQEQLQLKVTYRYEGGLLKETVYHKADAALGARAVYEYDRRGNCTSLTKYNADGTFAAAVERRYEYDAVGNWVTIVSYSRLSENAAPVPYIVTRRRIEYY